MDRKILKTISTLNKLNIDELNELNLGVEIQDFVEPNLTDSGKDYLTRKYKNKLGQINNIKSIHGPFLDLRPASPDKMIRDVSYDKYLHTLQIAKELEVDYLIFHSQINPYLNEPGLRRLNCYQAKEFWDRILKEVPDFKGTIVIENIFEETPEMLKEMIETINMPNIKINLDIGHANLGTAPLEEWIKELKDYIAYIHIHSNDGKHDTHNRPEDEEIKKLYSLLDKYNINPILSLEYSTSNLEEEINRYR